jgi:hypothetical protein
MDRSPGGNRSVQRGRVARTILLNLIAVFTIGPRFLLIVLRNQKEGDFPYSDFNLAER